jgi:hypothetical protein
MFGVRRRIPTVQHPSHRRKGKTSSRKVMACVSCGDSAFSPEQYTAQKMKGVAKAQRPLLSCGMSDCPGCINCGRGMSNR